MIRVVKTLNHQYNAIFFVNLINFTIFASELSHNSNIVGHSISRFTEPRLEVLRVIKIFE